MRTPEVQTDSLRAYLLEANPNPERIGCPPEGAIQAAAENRVGADDPVRLHLTTCSECFAEFRGYKLDWEEQRRAKTRFIGWAAAAVVIVGIVSGLIAMNHSKRSQGPQQEMAQTTPPQPPSPYNGDEVAHKPPQQNPPVAVDNNTKTDNPPRHPHIPDDGSVRLPKQTAGKDTPTGPKEPHSPGDPTGPATPAPVTGLPNVTFDLRVTSPVSGSRARSEVQLKGLHTKTMNASLLLPNTAESGSYEVRVSKDVHGREMIESAHGIASRIDGVLTLKVQLSLDDSEPGDYFLLTIHEGDRSTRAYSVHVD